VGSRSEKKAVVELAFLSDSDSVFISEFHEGFEFITNHAIVSILNVVRPLIALPPFLEAVGGDANKKGSACLVEDRIVVIRGQRLGFQPQEGGRYFATLGRADRNGSRIGEGL
jgi:hypothetical protein